MKKIIFLLIILLAVVALLFYTKNAGATSDNDWSSCILTVSQCGTDNGIQNKTVTTSFIGICPNGYRYQNSGKFNKRCHRIENCSDEDKCLPEHKSPIGTDCPEGYIKSGNGEDTICSKVITQSCHTGVIDNRACEEEPVPTATPSAIPTPVLIQSNNGGESSGASSVSNPVCTIDIDAPILQGFKKTSPTSIFWSWWGSKISNLDHQWIEYGYSKGNYPYNVTVPVDVTGFEIGAQDPYANQHWARVCVQKGACVACSNDLDP